MAWSWSHSQDGYANARDNLSRLSHLKLRTIYAEWKAHDAGVAADPEAHEPFVAAVFRKARPAARSLSADVLADAIWERASAQALCDNGGHRAWLCPYGCGCHQVAFS